MKQDFLEAHRSKEPLISELKTSLEAGLRSFRRQRERKPRNGKISADMVDMLWTRSVNLNLITDNELYSSAMPPHIFKDFENYKDDYKRKLICRNRQDTVLEMCLSRANNALRVLNYSGIWVPGSRVSKTGLFGLNPNA